MYRTRVLVHINLSGIRMQKSEIVEFVKKGSSCIHCGEQSTSLQRSLTKKARDVLFAHFMKLIVQAGLIGLALSYISALGLKRHGGVVSYFGTWNVIVPCGNLPYIFRHDYSISFPYWKNDDLRLIADLKKQLHPIFGAYDYMQFNKRDAVKFQNCISLNYPFFGIYIIHCELNRMVIDTHYFLNSSLVSDACLSPIPSKFPTEGVGCLF